MIRPSVRSWRLAALALLAWAGPAQAHAPVPGIEGFYVGLLHPYSTPAQALVMVGLGLLVAGYSVAVVRWLLGGFLVASLGAVVAGTAGLALDPPMYAVAFAAGVAAALLPGRAIVAAMALTVFGGALIGLASIPDPGPPRDRLFTIAGSMLGANVGLLYMFGIGMVLRERFDWPWAGVAARIVAAWLSAVALLMFALGYAGVAAG